MITTEDVVKMKEPFIFLSPEVTRENALKLVHWLQDEEVRKYLSDPKEVSANIEQVINRVELPVVTHFFNHGGRFFMAFNSHNAPVGFVRLIQKGNLTEMVIVIGDKSNWGRRFGTNTIRESMKIAFFEMRTEKIVAKIHKDNKRSIKAFINAGFVMEKESDNMKHFGITMDQYLKSARANTEAPSRIFITEIDKERLKKLLEEVNHYEGINEKAVEDLEKELERAVIVKPQQLPQDVVTMNTRALLNLNGEDMEISLVYPEEADWLEQKLSVFSPIGTAILGYSEGDIIQWEVPSGVTEIHIRKILYQPEAAGDFHL